MRVALLSWDSLNPIMMGDAKLHITQFAEALHRLGNEVHVFARVLCEQNRHEEINGVMYHRCFSDFNSDFISEIDTMCNSFSNSFSEVEKTYGEFDVVHGHDWVIVNALSQIKAKSKAKIIFTVHSTEFGRCGNNFYKGMPRVIRDLEWCGVRISDKIIVVSQHLKDEVEWLYNVPDWKISVIYDGANIKRFYKKMDPEKIKEKYEIEPSDSIFLFVGGMGEEKECKILSKAIQSVIKDFPDTKFIFVGNGCITNYLKRELWELGISDACRFLGYIPDEDLIDLYKASDVVCLPSRNEPYGIVVLQEWNSEKPIVMSYNGFDYAEHETDGLKAYDNPDSLAQGIKKILSDSKAAKKIGEGGKTIEIDISWDGIADKMLEVYFS
ncbi:MAG: glycosyltransferase family 4 protein [Halobacteriota archaeon]|nr:glycosyltransferase family 4 protein [Halobacteriota archaeon]